jgi:hypothetical protein
VSVSPSAVSVKAVDDDGGTYSLLGKSAGQPQQLTLVPFADTDMPYRLWIKASE